MSKPSSPMTACMFVLNSVLADPRVMRAASALTQNGWVVTVIGLHDEPREDIVHQGIRITLLRRNFFFRLALRFLNKNRPAVEKPAGRNNPSTSAVASIKQKTFRFGFDCGEIVHMLLTNLAMAWAGVRLKALVYHSHDLNTIIAGYIASRCTGAKLIYDFHEAYTEQFSEEATTKCWRQFYSIMEKALIVKTDRAITVCNSLSQWAQQRYGVNRVEVIMNTSTFREISPPTADNSSGITVLYHGIYMKDRGLEQLIESAKFFAPGITLVLRGKGDIEPSLRTLVQMKGLGDRVVFAPPVPMEELVSSAASADIGVIPYIATNLNNRFSTPNKLFEYMMAGLAIAGSDLPELRAIIMGERLGGVFDPTIPRDIARVVNGLAADREALARIKRTSLAAAKEKYNWDRESHKLIMLYKEICAE